MSATENKKKKRSNNDAFAVLMQSQKRRQQELRGSRFVLCPVGCGRHFSANDMNRHIDSCLVEQATKGAERKSMQSQQSQQFETETVKQCDAVTDDERRNNHTEAKGKHDQVVTPEKAAFVIRDQESRAVTVTEEKASAVEKRHAILFPEEENNIESQATLVSIETEDCQNVEEGTDEAIELPDKDFPDKTDAFARMMSQSRTVFSKPRTSTKHCFHLNENGTVSLFFHQQPATLSVAWSTSLRVKDRSDDVEMPAEFDVDISSALPNTLIEAPNRRVRRHSRLSVPVLKSILQKSIRRRRPLPAVRVAMELAEKSLGDLLRRLPIIILEDSSLHPDFGLLVWLMMAQSKDYNIPDKLMIRVYEIIFEVASCRWVDHLSLENLEATTISERPCTLAALSSEENREGIESHREAVDVETILLWSILIRAEFGGMRCDVLMLRRYAKLWLDRFSSLDCSISVKGVSQWRDLPECIHQQDKIRAQEMIPPLYSSGLEHLEYKDICIEGVDFHCSNILETLLSDKPFCDLCMDLLLLDKDTAASSANLDRRSWLESILKKCMWVHCSGVNRRLPLVKKQSPDHPEEGDYAEFWKHLVAARVTEFQKMYIEQRLVR